MRGIRPLLETFLCAPTSWLLKEEWFIQYGPCHLTSVSHTLANMRIWSSISTWFTPRNILSHAPERLANSCLLCKWSTHRLLIAQRKRELANEFSWNGRHESSTRKKSVKRSGSEGWWEGCIHNRVLKSWHHSCYLLGHGSIFSIEIPSREILDWVLNSLHSIPKINKSPGDSCTVCNSVLFIRY